MKAIQVIELKGQVNEGEREGVFEIISRFPVERNEQPANCTIY